VAGRGALSREEIASLRTIGEVAEQLDLPQHVLRFWETRFTEIEPVKRAGGRRFYRPRDIALVEAIRHLLYREGYTIKGVQRILAEQGTDAVIADVQRRRSDAPAPAQPDAAPEIPAAPPPEPPAPAQVALDLPEPETAPRFVDPPAAPYVPAPEPEPAPEYTPPAPPPAPVFNPPVLVTRRRDHEQARLLREALADIDECKRLLALTRR
jgi:DNA-binding transcriptional MerR regulator